MQGKENSHKSHFGGKLNSKKINDVTQILFFINNYFFIKLFKKMKKDKYTYQSHLQNISGLQIFAGRLLHAKAKQ